MNGAMRAAVLFFFIGSACNGLDRRSNAEVATVAYNEIPISKRTSAPRRVSVGAQLNAPLQEVWSYLTDHKNLKEYSNGVLGSVSIDASAANAAGVGTKRQCVTADGSGRFLEEVVYVKAPHVFAYRVVENTWGLTDHLAIVSLKSAGEGSTVVTWDLHFNHVQADMVPKMSMNMAGMMKGKMLPFLAQKFGGQVLPGG